jgi:hypothetical protein
MLIMHDENETISAEELDRLFDEGEEDILQYFDMENAVRLGDEQEKVTIPLPKLFHIDYDRRRRL